MVFIHVLRHDPAETRNLVEQAACADVRRGLAGRLDAFFARYAEAKYDLWRGGVSKAHRLVRPAGKPSGDGMNGT